MPFDPAITLCSMKELQAHLNVGRDFILAMRHAGFPMPGRRATVADALAWLKDNPTFNRERTLNSLRPSRQKQG